MLLRIIDHFRDNPKRIDKLIAIKGLPEEWFFHKGPEGTELKKPWKPDIEANIPMDIRHLCEPMYLTFRFPSIDASRKEFIERRQVIGFRIDYNSEPGREMWDQVERYIEESIPRNERVPIPVVCAKDERSAFETYTPRRTATRALELVPSPIPMLDLTRYSVKVVEVIEPISPPEEEKVTPPVEKSAPQAATMKFKCPECEYEHVSKRGVAMHKMKRHPAKEKVPT